MKKVCIFWFLLHMINYITKETNRNLLKLGDKSKESTFRRQWQAALEVLLGRNLLNVSRLRARCHFKGTATCCLHHTHRFQPINVKWAVFFLNCQLSVSLSDPHTKLCCSLTPTHKLVKIFVFSERTGRQTD